MGDAGDSSDTVEEADNAIDVRCDIDEEVNDEEDSHHHC